MRLALAAALLPALAACTFGGGGLLPSSSAPVAAPARAADSLEVPYVPTPRPVVAAMLDMAGVGPEDFVVDLGSGDGRIAIMAAERGARALGVDLDPARIEQATTAARLAQLESRVRFRRQDLFATPLAEASVVTLYLLPEVNLRLRPRLLTELRPGARVVSHAFAMGDWRPDRHRQVDGANVYLWIVPAAAGGRWALRDGDGPERILELDQRFQELAGTLAGVALDEAALRGTRIRLRAGPRSYEGMVDGAEMRGEGWSARRIG